MLKAVRRPALPGVAAALAGALAYGITIVIGGSLAQSGLAGAAVLTVRFGVAAAMLLVILVFSGRPLLPVAGERAAAVLLGAFGYSVESSFFYLGLTRGSAAAVALIFYCYPAMVVALEVVLRRAGLDGRTLACLALSAVGTIVVVASAGGVRISAAGVLYSLASAATFSGYLVTSERRLTRTDALTCGAWVTSGCAAAQALRGAFTGTLAVPPGHWLQLLAYGGATAVAFCLMFIALQRLGSSRTAMVMTMEAVFAVVLAAIFLGDSVGPLQMLGGAATLSAAAIIAWSPIGPAPPQD